MHRIIAQICLNSQNCEFFRTHLHRAVETAFVKLLRIRHRHAINNR